MLLSRLVKSPMPLPFYPLVQPSLQLGHCWPMAGAEGRITVRLARPIAISAVTIDHPQLAIALDRSTAAGGSAAGAAEASVLPPPLAGLNNAAPRAFRLYGYTSAGSSSDADHHHHDDVEGHTAGNGTGAAAAGDSTAADAAALLRLRRVLLGSFRYDATGPRTQTFLLPQAQSQTQQEQAQELFSHVTLEVASNHGHPNFTCLYRLRVHGTVPSPVLHVQGQADPAVFTPAGESVPRHDAAAAAGGDAPPAADYGTASSEQH